MAFAVCIPKKIHSISVFLFLAFILERLIRRTHAFWQLDSLRPARRQISSRRQQFFRERSVQTIRKSANFLFAEWKKWQRRPQLCIMAVWKSRWSPKSRRWSAIRQHFPCNNAHKGGFSFSVGPDKTNVLSFQKSEWHIIEDCTVSKSMCQVFYI